MRPIPKNLLELNLALVIRLVARIAGVALLASRLGLDGYGKLSWALTLFYLGVADDLGIGSWASRGAAVDRRFFTERAVGIAVAQLGLAVVRGAILFALLPWICPDAFVRSLARWLALATLPVALQTGWLHFARDRTGLLRTGTLLREGIWFVGIVLLVHRTADLPTSALVILFAESVATAYLLWEAIRREGRPDWAIRLPSPRDVFGDALPLWFTGRLFHWRSHVGTLVLGGVFGAAAVGAYDLAWRAAFNVWQFGATSLGAVTPTLFRTARTDGAVFSDVSRRALRLSFAGAVGVAAVVGVTASPACRWLLGASGRAVVPALVLLALGLVPAICRSQTRAILFALGRSRALAGLAAVDGLALSPAVVAAAAMWGPRALAGGMAAVEAILLLASLVLIGRPLLAGGLRAGLRYVTLAAVAAAAGLVGGRLGFVPGAILAASTFVGSLVLLRDPAYRDVRGFLLHVAERP